MALDCFFAVWFVVGNVWIFGGHASAAEAPNLYRYVHWSLTGSFKYLMAISFSNQLLFFSQVMHCLSYIELHRICYAFHLVRNDMLLFALHNLSPWDP